MDTSIATEYRQWQFSFELSTSFLKWLGFHQDSPTLILKEAVNILHHWLLSIQQNSNSRDELVPLFPFIEESHEAVLKFVSVLFNKKFKQTLKECTDVVRKVCGKIETFRNKCHSNPAIDPPAVETIQTEENKTKLIIGKCETPSSVRLHYLIQRFGLEDTVKMVLRYEAVGNGSYQWGDAVSVHRMFYDEFGARYEAFSSPLNSRFLGKSDTKFCSVFYDTDCAFGSLGNFLEVDLSQYEGGWTVNPPFIESILNDAVRKILQALECGANSYFFFYFPYWDDCTGWCLLNESRYKVAQYNFSGGEFIMQDAYGASLRPKMKLSVFIIGHLPENCPSIERVREVVFRKKQPDT